MASLEASVLAMQLGHQRVHVQDISACTIKTLAGAGIANFNKLLGCKEKHAPLKRNATNVNGGQQPSSAVNWPAASPVNHLCGWWFHHHGFGYNRRVTTDKKCHPRVAFFIRRGTQKISESAQLVLRSGKQASRIEAILK
jgi:hypothetical protein